LPNDIINPASVPGALGVATVRMSGVQGAAAVSDTGYLRMPAVPVEMRDTLAAADCFTGVLAAALARDAGMADGRLSGWRPSRACWEPGLFDRLPEGRPDRLSIREMSEQSVRAWEGSL